MAADASPLGNLEGDVENWWPTPDGGYCVVSAGMYSGGGTFGRREYVQANKSVEDRAIFDALMFERPKKYRWHEQFGPVPS